MKHIEIARDIAQRFNHLYGEVFVLPEAIVDEHSAILPGLDGRKMSKSYGNTIPLFSDSKELLKLINKIKTDSLPPEAPKQTKGCSLFQLYQAFAKPQEVETLAARYAQGIGWGEMKKILHAKIDAELGNARERYQYYLAHSKTVETILTKGAERARGVIGPILKQVKQQCGLAV